MNDKVETEDKVKIIKMRLGFEDLSIGEFIMKLEEAPIRKKAIRILEVLENQK